MKNILVNLAVFLLAGFGAAGTGLPGMTPAGHRANPVFRPEQGVEHISVLFDPRAFGETGSRYRMWYSFYDREGRRMALGLSVSDDGRSWKTVAAGDISGLHRGDIDRPVVLYDAGRFGRRDGPLYKIWYWTGPAADDSIESIRHAESDDGINWSGDRPVEQSPRFPLVTGGDPVSQSDPGGLTSHSHLQNWFYRIKGPGTVIYNPHASNTGIETPSDRSDDAPLSYRFVMYYDSASEGFSPDGSIRQISLAYSTDGIF